MTAVFVSRGWLRSITRISPAARASPNCFRTLSDIQPPPSKVFPFLHGVKSSGMLSNLVRPLLWRNVLIQSKEVIWIIGCLDGDQPIPALAIRFGCAIFFVSTHKIYVHSRSHGWAQLRKQISNP